MLDIINPFRTYGIQTLMSVPCLKEQYHQIDLPKDSPLNQMAKYRNTKINYLKHVSLSDDLLSLENMTLNEKAVFNTIKRDCLSMGHCYKSDDVIAKMNYMPVEVVKVCLQRLLTKHYVYMIVENENARALYVGNGEVPIIE